MPFLSAYNIPYTSRQRETNASAVQDRRGAEFTMASFWSKKRSNKPGKVLARWHRWRANVRNSHPALERLDALLMERKLEELRNDMLRLVASDRNAARKLAIEIESINRHLLDLDRRLNDLETRQAVYQNQKI